MSRIDVYAMSVRANELVDFLGFMLIDFVVNQEHLLGPVGEELDVLPEGDDDAPTHDITADLDLTKNSRRRKPPPRSLWTGWLSKSDLRLAGLLISPRVAKSYSSVEKVNSVVKVKSVTLEGTDELNFFVYDGRRDVLIYAHARGSLSPQGFLDLLRPRYGRHVVAERKKVPPKERKRTAYLDSEYFMKPQDLIEALGSLRNVKVTLQTAVPTLGSSRAPAGVGRFRSVASVSVSTDETRMGFVGWLTSLFREDPSCRALIEDAARDTRINLESTTDLTRVQSRLALARFDQDEWHDLVHGEEFTPGSFPRSAKADTLLKPISVLASILDSSEFATFLLSAKGGS